MICPNTRVHICSRCIPLSGYLGMSFGSASSPLWVKRLRVSKRSLVRFIYNRQNCMATTSSGGGRPCYRCIRFDVAFLTSVRGTRWKLSAMMDGTKHAIVAQRGFWRFACSQWACSRPFSCRKPTFLCLCLVSEGPFCGGLANIRDIVHMIAILVRSASDLACHGWIPSFFHVSQLQVPWLLFDGSAGHPPSSVATC